MTQRLKLTLGLLLTLNILPSVDSRAQDNGPSSPRVVGGPSGLSGAQCHTTKLELDDALLEAHMAGQGTSIILIARLGVGERDRRLSRERLRQLAAHLTENRSLPKGRLVTAEAGRTRGLGQVEVYVGGKLYVILKAKRGRDFATGCVLAG